MTKVHCNSGANAVHSLLDLSSEMGKILGLDVGDKRVGMALSDASALIASPAGFALRAKGAAEEEIISLIKHEGIDRVVVGLPLDASNAPTPQSEKVKNFCRRLQRRVQVEIVYIDEFLSSVQAEELLREKARSARRQKGMVDALSASIILQQYLDTEHDKVSGAKA